MEVFAKHHPIGMKKIFREKKHTQKESFVFRSLSSNTTSGMKKQHQYLHQQPMPTQDYPNTCYQINGSNNTQNPLNYPPPPSYGAPMYQQSNGGPLNPAFQTTPGLFGYSRPPSPVYPHSNVSNQRKKINTSKTFILFSA